MYKKFDIVYADGSTVSGTTAAQFKAAPRDEDYTDGGITFVVILYSDGRIIMHKGLSWYEYRGEKKQGSWTNRENYFALRSGLADYSPLLKGKPSPLPDLTQGFNKKAATCAA